MPGARPRRVVSAGAPPRRATGVPYRVTRGEVARGLRLVVVETPYLHAATVVVYARVGSRFETPVTNGLSHFVEHMLFRGSAAYPDSLALNRAIEELGGTLHAETGRDYSLYQVHVDPRAVPGALAILGDLFATPRFSSIELERKIVLEEIREDFDDRGRHINLYDIARRLAWVGPLGFSIAGPARNIRRFRRSDVRRHFRRFYGARNLVLCVAGPVDAAAVRRVAARAFAAVPRGKAARLVPPAPGARGPIVRAVDHGAAQTQVQMLFHALPETDPDYLAAVALLRVLDDGMSTRLHYRVCDQKGLAYNATAGIESFYDAALLEIESACAPAKLPALVREVLAILGELRDAPVSDAELAKAKHRYRADLEAGFDDVDGLAGWFGGTEMFRRADGHAERLARMERVTAGDLQRVARNVLDTRRLTVAIVGAASRAVVRRVRDAVRACGF